MAKSRDAFRTISEVASWLDTPAHVLRFWESKFTQVKPVKRAGGRRYYRPDDMRLLGGIKKLLHKDGMTIKGAQQILRDQGIEHVAAMSIPLDVDAPSDTASSEKPAKAEVKPKTDKATAADAPAAPEATTTAETVPEQPETAPSEAVNEVEATDDTVSDAAQSTADEAQKAPEIDTAPAEAEAVQDQTESPEDMAPAAVEVAESEAPEPEPEEAASPVDEVEVAEAEAEAEAEPIAARDAPQAPESNVVPITPAAAPAPLGPSNIPPDPNDADVDGKPGVMAKLAKAKEPSPELAALLARLKILRERMSRNCSKT